MHSSTLTSDFEQVPALFDTQQVALVIAWSTHDPTRLGDLLLPPEGPSVVGRGGPEASDPAPKLGLWRHRPGERIPRPPLACRRTSRQQLLLHRDGDTLLVRRLGRAPMAVNGRVTDEATVRQGDVIEIGIHLLLLVDRAAPLPAADAIHDFGQPDTHGLVGETAAIWAVRQRIAFAAARHPHVLISGPSGTGKELVARAMHADSGRSGSFVSRNAATIPSGVFDVELFGHARDYPIAGSPERPGLVASAHRGTLFLDEFGEMPVDNQAHLLRVLDEGEYHRLGEHEARHVDLRLVAATNQPDTSLRADLLARFQLRVRMPPLQARRADIPLIAMALATRIAQDEPDLQRRFLGPNGPRLGASFVRQLLQRDYTTHVREMEAMMWQAMAESPSDHLQLVELAPPPSTRSPTPDWTVWKGHPAREIPPEALAACMRDHGLNQVRAAEALGLSSRHVLARLLRRHGLSRTIQ